MPTLGYHDSITVFISEFGLYDVLVHSRKPIAKQFQRWITHEVIPPIKEIGSYTYNTNLPVVDVEPEAIAIASSADLSATKPAISNEADLLNALLDWKT